MVPDRQKVWTDGRRKNYIPPTLSGDDKSLFNSALQFISFLLDNFILMILAVKTKANN